MLGVFLDETHQPGDRLLVVVVLLAFHDDLKMALDDDVKRVNMQKDELS
jgi:hypothetical protein